MTLLLDTCTFLWLLSDDPRLPLRTRRECRAPSNAVYLSALSVWEITIKYRLGRLPLPESPELFVASRRQRLQIDPLPYDERDATHDVRRWCQTALLHESSRARTMPPDRILTCRGDTTRVGRGRSSD